MNHDEWLDRWFDGDLTTTELVDFESALRNDDLLRRSLVERSLLEANLIDALAGAKPRKRRRRPVRQTRSWAPFAAAAAVLLASALFVMLRPKPLEPVVVRQPRSEVAPPELPKEREPEVVKPPPPEEPVTPEKREERAPEIKPEPKVVPPLPPTRAAIARVAATPTRDGYDVLPGDRLEGALSVAFPDGTRLQTVDGTELRLETGRVHFAHGSLSAVGRLAITTPHSELAIDGASRVAVNGATSVEVAAGTATLKRLRDGRTLLVKAGFTADSTALLAKPVSKEEVALRYEFAKKPPELLEGVVAKGVLNGVEKRERGTLRRQIAIEKKEGLFTVVDGMALRFDCWMKGGGGSLSIYLWDATQRANVFIVVPGIRENAWTKVVVKFDDLRIEGSSTRGAKAGDVIGNLLISLFDEQPAVLQIDNLEVAAQRGK